MTSSANDLPKIRPLDRENNKELIDQIQALFSSPVMTDPARTNEIYYAQLDQFIEELAPELKKDYTLDELEHYITEEGNSNYNAYKAYLAEKEKADLAEKEIAEMEALKAEILASLLIPEAVESPTNSVEDKKEVDVELVASTSSQRNLKSSIESAVKIYNDNALRTALSSFVTNCRDDKNPEGRQHDIAFFSQTILQMLKEDKSGLIKRALADMTGAYGLLNETSRNVLFTAEEQQKMQSKNDALAALLTKPKIVKKSEPKPTTSSNNSNNLISAGLTKLKAPAPKPAAAASAPAQPTNPFGITLKKASERSASPATVQKNPSTEASASSAPTPRPPWVKRS